MDNPSWLFGGSPSRQRLLGVDWFSTPLGPLERWPSGLRAAVRLCLTSKSATAVWAGPEFHLIHNEGYLAVLGPERAGALGRPAREVWSEVWSQISADFEQVLRGEARWYENVRYLLTRGQHTAEAFFNYALTPIQEDDGRITGIFNTLEETTRSVRERAEREEFLSFALATAHLGAWDLDVLEGGAHHSAEHARIFGDSSARSEWSFADLIARVVPEDRAEVEKTLRSAIASRTEGTFEFRIFREDGRVRWLRAAGRHRVDERGRPRFSGVVEDITERRADREAILEANARLLEADRRKNLFLATLSHELRNPLVPIKNGLYVLGRAAPGSEQARRAQEIVQRQVDQLARLVEDLLDLTRLSRDKIQLQRERFELHELLRRSVEDHRALFDQRGVRLELLPGPDALHLHADWNRITQVVGNLLTNAARFTPRGGHVTVSLTADAEARQAVIRVADSGVGIEPSVLARLFEPFVQADATLERTGGGLGLGLALIKGLVELHGGTVEGASAGPGQGAEFTVRLPLAQAEPAPTQEHSGHPVKVRRRVLIIEDNVDAAESLRALLELDDHEVEVAYRGPEGLARVKATHPEVVLCDIGLPGMNGYEIAQAIREDASLRETFLVAVSGYALPEDLQRAEEAGFDRHLAKPPSLEQLDAVLQEALGPGPSRAPT